jgi:hypothetical protein
MTKRILYATALAVILPIITCGVAEAAQGGFGSTSDTIPFFVTGNGSEAVVGSWNQNALSATGDVVANSSSPNNTSNGATVIANGSVRLGYDVAACSAGQAGAMRWNASSSAFEGCNGSSWQPIGGSGNTIVEGGCQTYWSGCPGGYHATSYFSPGTYNCCDKCGNPAWRYTVCSQ